VTEGIDIEVGREGRVRQIGRQRVRDNREYIARGTHTVERRGIEERENRGGETKRKRRKEETAGRVKKVVVTRG
jgi:hypothetical protein